MLSRRHSRWLLKSQVLRAFSSSPRASAPSVPLRCACPAFSPRRSTFKPSNLQTLFSPDPRSSAKSAAAFRTPIPFVFIYFRTLCTPWSDTNPFSSITFTLFSIQRRGERPLSQPSNLQTCNVQTIPCISFRIRTYKTPRNCSF